MKAYPENNPFFTQNYIEFQGDEICQTMLYTERKKTGIQFLLGNRLLLQISCEIAMNTSKKRVSTMTEKVFFKRIKLSFFILGYSGSVLIFMYILGF